MRDSCPCEGRQRLPSGSPRLPEPINEPRHLTRDIPRWRCFKMNLRRIHRSRDYLHRLTTCAVTSDISNVMPSAHHHPVPAENHFFRKRVGECARDIHHHLRNALLFCPNPPFVSRKPKLPLNRMTGHWPDPESLLQFPRW